MQQQGFDYAYDKRLYDRLREGHARPVREHFHAGLDYQNKLARFLENHDELRAAATFPPEIHQAAAVITFLSPGLRFFHQGQFEGRRNRISPHLCRGPAEPVDQQLKQFYDRLLGVLRQLDLGLFPGLRLARSRRRAAAGGGELCPQPEPVLRPATVCGPWGRRMAVAESTGGRRLRSRWRRFAVSRIVPGCTSLAGLCLRPDEKVLRPVGKE